METVLGLQVTSQNLRCTILGRDQDGMSQVHFRFSLPSVILLDRRRGEGASVPPAPIQVTRTHPPYRSVLKLINLQLI